MKNVKGITDEGDWGYTPDEDANDWSEDFDSGLDDWNDPGYVPDD